MLRVDPYHNIGGFGEVMRGNIALDRESTIKLSSNATDDFATSSEWAQLCSGSESPYALYASPQWVQAVLPIHPERYLIGAISSPKGELTSLVPFSLGEKKLEIVIHRNRSVSRQILRCAHVMSGEPLGMGTAEDYAKLFGRLLRDRRELDGLYFKCVREESEFMRILHTIGSVSGDFICIDEYGRNTLRFARLGASYKDYLSKFRKKGRYNLRRQLRMLTKATQDTLELTRITRPEQIEQFAVQANAVLSRSWKANTGDDADLFSTDNCAVYRSLAERGFLRSYLLTSKGGPQAFVVGYQQQGVYHYSNIAYDEKIAQFSPGTALLYILLEDLFRYRKPEVVSFGIGDAEYKKRFATDSFRYSSILLLRKSMRTRWIAGVYKLLNSVKWRAQKLVGKGI